MRTSGQFLDRANNYKVALTKLLGYVEGHIFLFTPQVNNTDKSDDTCCTYCSTNFPHCCILSLVAVRVIVNCHAVQTKSGWTNMAVYLWPGEFQIDVTSSVFPTQPRVAVSLAEGDHPGRVRAMRKHQHQDDSMLGMTW